MIDRQRAGRARQPQLRCGEEVVGRKRHISVDGHLLLVNLTTADISDSAGAQPILEAIRKTLALDEASVRRRRL